MLWRGGWVLKMDEEKTIQLLQDIRDKSEEILSRLEKRKLDKGTEYKSWIRGVIDVDTRTSNSRNFDSCSKIADEEEMFYPTERCQCFDRYGFITIPSFSNKSENEAMKSQMRTLVDESWFPGKEKTAIFRTDEKHIEAQGSNDYFLESASRIHFFLQKKKLWTIKMGFAEKRICTQ